MGYVCHQLHLHALAFDALLHRRTEALPDIVQFLRHCAQRCILHNGRFRGFIIAFPDPFYLRGQPLQIFCRRTVFSKKHHFGSQKRGRQHKSSHLPI